MSTIADRICSLRREVVRTKSRWMALSADVSEDVETQARDAYYQASSQYLSELETYFVVSERASARTGT